MLLDINPLRANVVGTLNSMAFVEAKHNEHIADQNKNIHTHTQRSAAQHSTYYTLILTRESCVLAESLVNSLLSVCTAVAVACDGSACAFFVHTTGISHALCYENLVEKNIAFI